MCRVRARHLLIFFVASFALHLTWENAQMPLYAGFETALLREHFWICFKATITGDMLFMLTIYLALTAVHRDWLWIASRGAYRHPATWFLPPLIGLLLAVSMEVWAVYIDHRWVYADTMPMIPVLEIGLTPVLQMLVIPIFSLLMTQLITPYLRVR